MKSRTFKPPVILSTLTLLTMVGAALHFARAEDNEDAASKYADNDYESAAGAYQAAADNGDADAQTSLGLMYLKGEGVEENEHTALSLFEKSAAQGDVRGEVNLARMYAKGKAGLVPDYRIAVSWFDKAATQGYADAKYSLGVLYVTGNGVPLNYRKAMELFASAADQNNASAQYQLGLMNFKGKGMPVNLIEAYKWLTIAGDFDDAPIYRQYVALKMNKEQIDQAVALADDWKQEAEQNQEKTDK
ncbi:tetratricopeptide repeat protein [Undibacterium sp. SXout20W]|uniref:tetratricopeptide repeat protein n=1 Tax=Undibacterium sp. SXout20W TaxID=3413051 RepID=UPI003BF3F155